MEIYHDGQWGTVCQNGFDGPDMQVVCRQLGCGSAKEVKTSSYFGYANVPIWMDDPYCDGSESGLAKCSHSGWGVHLHYCDHSKDVGVVCEERKCEFILILFCILSFFSLALCGKTKQILLHVEY